MQKTFKNVEIINVIPALEELSQIKLPIKASWNLSKNLKKIQEIFADINKCQQELIKEYSIKDEQGNVKSYENNMFKIVPSKVDEFNLKMNELLDCENEVDILPIKLDLSYFDNKDISITSSALYSLEFMLEEENQ